MSTQTQALEKAGVLAEALPWLLEFQGATLVIKFGGNAMIHENLFKAFAQDVVFLKLAGINPVVVHGGGPQITSALSQAKLESRFIKGLRYTPREAIEIIKDTMLNVINKSITDEINAINECAFGISGDEFIKGRKIQEIDGEEIDLGMVGEVESVTSNSLLEIIQSGKIPVISTLAKDEFANTLNVNADYAAGAIASALKSQKLIILTDVVGLLKDYPNPESLISEITIADLEKLIPQLDEGMRPKMQACLWSVENGVLAAHVIDGRIAHGLMVEIFTDQGAGTMVVP